MINEDFFYFNLLKREVATVFLKNHAISDAIKDWKGEEIILFQEDLFARVKAKVSEKWFYTYFKNDHEKLPRIDMLNLLSEYVGQKNWNTFKSNHRTKLKTHEPPSRKKMIYLFLATIPILVFLWFGLNTKNEFQFCFVDDLLNEPIVKAPLQISILSGNESPIHINADSLGCFSYRTSEDYLRFVVRSPFYNTDTIVRFVENGKNRNIPLSSDDYALMLKYYTEGNVVDWRKHKEGLVKLIDNRATIYKLNGKNIGIELFTKDEFIRLLTIPTSDLKRIKILDKTMQDGKVVKLKFIVL